MKKYTLLVLCSLLFFYNKTTSYAGTFTSLGVGPAAWNGGAASWTIVGDADGIPDSDDDVIVQAGHTISATVSGNCFNLTVDGTLSYTSTGNLNVWADYTVNGTESGNGNINFVGASLPVRSISGTGTFSTYMRWTFVRNRNIASTVSVTRIAKTRINAGIIVRNSGNIGIRQVELYTGCSWINETGSTLSINTDATFFTGVNQNIGTFDASAVGNTVIINSANLDLPNTSAGYYNLTLAFPTSGVKKLASNTTILNNLTINSNNTLNSNGFDLSIGGNWTKNGLFIASTGKSVIFNGTVAQTLSGAGVTAFTGLTIDNTSGVSLAGGSYTLSEVLTLNDGTFNTAGMTFTMLSTATSTARIAPIAGTGAATGNFVIQRFISARDTTYSDLSSPVQSSTFLDWDNELPAISYSASFPTQYTYDESADVYVPVTSSGTALSPGQGFEVYLTGSFAYANFPATTMNTIGVPNQGDLPITISNNVQGWNLVGNPFASSISWASIYSDPGTTNIYDWVEMYDYTIEDWAGFDSGSGVEIGSSQGFWVYGEFAAPTLMIPESAKTTSNASNIRASVKTQPYFNLKISSSSFKYAHNFKMSTSENASNGLDSKDIPFRASLNKATPQMYCEMDGKKINVNNFNSSNDSYSIPLKTKVTVSGNYKLEASGFDFVDYTCIKLQDNLSGKIIDLTTNPYYFTMNSTDNPDRFILLFSKDENCKSLVSATTSPSVEFSNQIEVLPTQDGNVVNFNLSETVKTNISVRNILGQTIVETISVNASNQSVNINLPEGFSGLYFIYIESEKDSITKKFVKK